MTKDEMDAVLKVNKEMKDAPEEDRIEETLVQQHMIYDKVIIDHKISRLQILLAAKEHGFDDEAQILELKKNFDKQMDDMRKADIQSKGLSLNDENVTYLDELIDKLFGADPIIR